MNDNFQILFELLEGPAQEVTGRIAATVPSELREKIAKFAAGKCTDEEREEMKKMATGKARSDPGACRRNASAQAIHRMSTTSRANFLPEQRFLPLRPALQEHLTKVGPPSRRKIF